MSTYTPGLSNFPLWIPGLIGIVLMAVLICSNVVIILGALRMFRLKSYGLAVTACILAMITPPGLILGLPAGIWALIVLSRREVREAFEANRSRATAGGLISTPHFSRTAIWGAVCLMLTVVFFGSAIAGAGWTQFLALQAPRHFGLNFRGQAQSAILVIVLGQVFAVLAALVGTFLGWIAVTQIRRSAGRLYGLGLAVFDGLVFPLIALDGLVVGTFFVVITNVIPSSAGSGVASPWHLGAIPLLMAVVADYLIARAVWRAVNKPLATGQSSPAPGVITPPPRSSGAWKVVAVVGAALLLVLAIPVGSMLLGLYMSYLTHQQTSPETVVRVEEKLRQEIEARMKQAGYKPDSVSVNVSPGLDIAECRLGPVSKLGLYSDGWNGSFKLRPLGKGLWQVEGQGELRALRFSVDTSAEMASAETGTRLAQNGEYQNLGPAGGQTVQFGPEKEVTMTEFNNRQGREALDLDSGTLFTQPKDFEEGSEADLAQWVEENGIDLLVDHGPQGVWGLITTTNAELKIAPVDPQKWDRIGERELADALAGGPAPLVMLQRGNLKLYVPSEGAHYPQTRAFQTSRGSRGLLQVFGDSNNPRGVKIRYKLVQSGHPSSEQSLNAFGDTASYQRNPDVLRVQIRQAEAEVARLKKLSDANLVAVADLDAAQDKLDILKAELDGDEVKVAQIRVMAAERVLRRVSDLFERKLVSPSELDAAKAKVEIRQAELRAAQADRGTGDTFGPVIERIINDPDFKLGNEALNLDTGESLDYPTDLQVGDLAAWLSRNGADLIAGRTDKWGFGTPLANELKLVSVPDSSWEQLTAKKLLSTVASDTNGILVKQAGRKDPFKVYFLPEKPEFPYTFGFETRQGTAGILQITGFTNNQHGLKMRYKLVQSSNGPTFGGNANFSPEAKVTLNVGEELLDLDAGKPIKLSRSYNDEPVEQLIQWIESHGANLWVNQDPWRLLTPNGNAVRLVLVANQAWDELTQRQLDRELMRGYPRIHVETAPQFTVYLLPTNPPPQTYAFATAQGARGLLQVTELELNPPRISLRFKTSSGPFPSTPATSQSRAPRSDLTFGPVIERVLLDAEMKTGYETLDLRTGRFLSMPQEQPNNDQLRLAWLATNSVDLIAFWDPDPEDSNKVYFTCIRTKVSDCENELWTNGSPADCLEALESGITLQPVDESSMDEDFTKAGVQAYILPPATQLPRTLAFRARDGISGLLQITGFTENPRGVQIRYKLVQESASTEPSTTNTPDETVNLPKPELDPQQTARLNEMRQMLTAAWMFADRHGGEWPSKLSELVQFIDESAMENIAASLEYHKPGAPTTVTNGETIMHIYAPVLFEKTAVSRDGEFVGFADGHVEFIKDAARLHALREATPGPVTSRDLIPRYEAAEAIRSSTERDPVLAAIAEDAARVGDWAMTRKALAGISASNTHDDAACEAATSLARFGQRAEALDIAKTINSSAKRDAALRELAE